MKGVKMTFYVTQHGKPLDSSKYTWNENIKLFSSDEDNLVLDFSDYDGVKFETGRYCTFKTGSNCKFITGSNCEFDIGFCYNFET